MTYGQSMWVIWPGRRFGALGGTGGGAQEGELG